MKAIKRRSDRLKIKYYRELAGLAQWELAEKLEVDQSTICKWETGVNVPLKKYLHKLADVFGVTVDELMQDGEVVNT